MNDFRANAEAAHAAGFTYFDQLGGRAVDGGFELWLRVMDPLTYETRLVKTELAKVDGLVSVADLWSGAAWAEDEFRRVAVPLTSSGGPAHPEEPK